MTEFLLVSSLLAVLAAGFVLLPLAIGRRDADADASQRLESNRAIFVERRAEIRADADAGRIALDEAQALEAELERSLLRDAGTGGEVSITSRAGGGTGLLLAAALVLPIFATVLYADWGASFGAQAELQLARDIEQLDAPPGGEGEAHQPADLDSMVDRLQARLDNDPEDPDGWFLLARTLLSLDRHADAARAFGEVATRVPGEVVPLVLQAQAAYLAANRVVTGEVRAVIDAALAIDPAQPIMLELLGMDAFARGDHVEAAEMFARVLATEIPDPDRRRFLEDGFARSRELAGLPPTSPPRPATSQAITPPAAPVASGAREVGGSPPGRGIHVTAEVAPELLQGLPSTARIFVLARPIGGRMPLAVQRIAPDARFEVTLTEQDAMNPAMSIAAAERVEVVVRLSMTGTAMPGPDDVEVVANGVPTVGSSVRARLDANGGRAEVEESTPSEEGTRAGTGVAANVPATPGRSEGAVGAARLRVLVEVPEHVELPPDATVFVFAREEGGPPMPLAVKRLTVADLPTVVTLDDASAMSPQRPLSSARSVRVVARVSRSGDVAAQAGDYEGFTPVVDPLAGDVSCRC